jgi:ABC-2 type transport system permease protein
MMMLLFLVLTSGQLLVRSMLEEKSNRVVEVLISSCSPLELMGGKIIGLSGLGLTQMGVWAVIGITLALKFSVTLIPVTSALLLGVYFVLGYLLYAGIFVCIGAPITTEQEAQQLTSYVSIVLVLPIMLAFPAMQDPHSNLVTFLTFFPLTAPTMMAMRIPVNLPSALEIIISIASLAIAALVVIWASGKIFRAAVLSYGKRPGFSELIRYLRA